MSTQIALPHDYVEPPDRSHKTARLGVAMIKLENLSYQTPTGRPRIPLQPEKTNHWKERFKDAGCAPNDFGNSIKAEISQTVLNNALVHSKLTINDLQDICFPKQLELPEGNILKYYHGQHRLEAAKQCFSPHDVWWMVDLYDEERWGYKCHVQEQNRCADSIPHDGTIFRLLDSDLNWKKTWRSKDTENDLKAIKKRSPLYEGLKSLIPFVGLWASFQKATLHRYNSLRCDDELIRYLDRIKHVWTSILNGDKELISNLDPETVELFEGRAPKISSVDREFITKAIENKHAFPLLHDNAIRLRLLQNAVSVDGIIVSIKTLAQDSLYLKDCAKAMWILIDPIDCQIRDAMQRMWHGYGGDYILLESANGLIKYGNTQTDNEEGFQIAYIQLWMFAMRDFHRLTSIVPKSDNKKKVPSTGPDPQCLFEFASLANALGFRSRAITSILDSDADRENVKNMLTIARPPAEYDYDLEKEITGHCQLLTVISDRQQKILKPPIWTTTLSNFEAKQRYGRPYNHALQDFAPHFFLQKIYEISETGNYITDLFVQRSIVFSFFHRPQLSPGVNSSVNTIEDIVVDGRVRPQQRNDNSQIYQAESQAQTRSLARNEAEDSALTSQLEECKRQVVEQQKEISCYDVKCSSMTAELERYRSVVAELKSEGERQHPVVEVLEQRLAEQSQQANTELEKLRSIISQWEEGDLQRPEEHNMKRINQATQESLAQLELVKQQQDESLRNFKAASTVKDKNLNTILEKIKKITEGVEKVKENFPGQPEFDPNHGSGDCETIDTDEFELGNVPEKVVHFNEIEDLQNSIINLIATYNRKALVNEENTDVKVLEWRKRFLNEQPAITDGMDLDLETHTANDNQTLEILSRRADVLEQKELDIARVTIENQRQRIELLEKLEKELVEVKRQLKQSEMSTIDLAEKLKAAQDTTQTSAETLQKKEEQLIALGKELKTANERQEELEITTKQEIQDLNQSMKSSSDEASKKLETYENRISNLEKDLSVASNIASEPNRRLELGNNEDERIKSLKDQLRETESLIDLEKEKDKLNTDMNNITEPVEGFGGSLYRKKMIDNQLSDIENKIVDAKFEILKSANFKVRLEYNENRIHHDIYYVPVKDFYAEIGRRNSDAKIVYFYENEKMRAVQKLGYKEILANSMYHHGEFYYSSGSLPRKRIVPSLSGGFGHEQREIKSPNRKL